MGNLIFGIVVGIVINIITALFNRDLALKILPWLLFYIFLHAVYVFFTTTEYGQQFVRTHRGWPSYIIAGFFGLLVWALIAYGVEKLDITTGGSKTPPNSEGKSQEETKDLPDVTLRFVYPEGPALLLVNLSDQVARDIKYTVVLWNLNLPDRIDPLPIPVGTFDWIRPHQSGGPQELFSTRVASLLKPGDRLIGSASVICPNCARGHTFVVVIDWGQGGWFAEASKITSGNTVMPPQGTKEDIAKYANRILKTPEHLRIPIAKL